MILRSEALELVFNEASGALESLRVQETDWAVLDRAQLGLSFRLLVPLSEERRNNQVWGETQRLADLQASSTSQEAVLTWDGLTSQLGQALDIRFTLNVALRGRQVIFTPRVENHSPYIVENVYCPYLGDLQPPAGAEWFRTFQFAYGSAVEWGLWPTYQNTRGYYGVDFPTQFGSGVSGGTPMSPFILLRGPRQGLYAGVAQASSELVAWHTELRPGYGDSMTARVAERGTLSGQEAHTRFAAVHVPYIQPGETRTLTPVALEPFVGGWQAGVDIYRAWRNTWMTLAEPPAWAREPHAWQQVHINSPEDELRVHFRDLVKIGVECARHGVEAIQLVGWNDGGQDQGNPSHDPDPRLGTFEDLKAAIAEIQALGLKVILFAKFTWADRATERFRRDLIRHAIKDPYGDYYLYGGYQYQTATQLLDINTKRLVPMCFLSDDYLRVCNEEFAKTLALGADGILFDECMHHGPALLCFDGSHGHRSGAPVYANDCRLIENFRGLTDATRPDFLFAGEGCYDWEMAVYHLAYHRSESKEHIPLARYLFPAGLYMTAVTGFTDRNMVNQCLLYRYIISYEPFNFKGRLEDFPVTLAYGKQMDALRRELREYFWDGEFRHEAGVQVSTEGKPHHPYAVYISRQTSKVGVVIANYDHQRPVTVQATLANGQSLDRYRLVDDPTWQPASNGIHLPLNSAAVAIEAT
jgi:hypothetical protein